MRTEEEMVDDLLEANKKVQGHITEQEYDLIAKFRGYASPRTLKRRFGSFNKAKNKAGLGNEINTPGRKSTDEGGEDE